MTPPAFMPQAKPAGASVDLTQPATTQVSNGFGIRRIGGVQFPKTPFVVGLIVALACAGLTTVSLWIPLFASVGMIFGAYGLWRRIFFTTNTIWISNKTLFARTGFRTTAIKVARITSTQPTRLGRAVDIQSIDNKNLRFKPVGSAWKQFADTFARTYPHVNVQHVTPKCGRSQVQDEYFEF